MTRTITYQKAINEAIQQEMAADPTAQLDAQQNSGLGAVDPLAYYILATA